MAVKTPADLSQKWWSKNKAKTLKSTGFGKALKAYEDAKKSVDGGKIAPLAGLQAAVDAADEVRKKRDAAEKACKKKLHDDTKQMLQAYTGLLTADAAKYVKQLSDMEKKVDACGKAAAQATGHFNKILKSMGAITKNYESARKAMDDAIKAGDKKKAAGLLKLAADFDGRVDKNKKTYEATKKSLNDYLAKSGVDARDTMGVKAIAESMRLNGPLENQIAAAEKSAVKIKKAAKKLASGSGGAGA